MKRAIHLGLILLSACGAPKEISIGSDTRDGGPPPPRDLSVDLGTPDSGEPLPDLEVLAQSVLRGVVDPGGPLVFSVLVRNGGSLGVLGSRISIVLEPLGVQAPVLLQELEVPALNIGSSWEQRLMLTVPLDLPPQRFRVLVQADPRDQIRELNEANNSAALGEVLVNDVVIGPRALQISAARGCAQRAPVLLENRGAQALRVLEFAQTGDPAFSLVTAEGIPIEGPVRIEPRSQLELFVRYSPQQEGLSNGTLLISHARSGVPVRIELQGEALQRSDRVDTFTDHTQQHLDILFVVDATASMNEELEDLARSFKPFFTSASVTGVDYHIAITSMDLSQNGEQGAFVGAPAVLSERVPYAGLLFTNRIRQLRSDWTIEEGLEAARLALSPPLLDHQNKGFLRDEAALAVLFFSDEDDNSPLSIEEYVRFFEGLKGHGQNKVHSLSVSQSNCGQGISSTNRYHEVARAMGGLTGEICNPEWSQVIAGLTGGDFGLLTKVELRAHPDASSLRIELDGRSVPATENGAVNWTYDPSQNTVSFDANLNPLTNVLIRARYELACGTD